MSETLNNSEEVNQVRYSPEMEAKLVGKLQQSLYNKEKGYSGVTLKTIIQEATQPQVNDVNNTSVSSYSVSQQARFIFVNTLIFLLSFFAVMFLIIVLYILFAKVISEPVSYVLGLLETTRTGVVTAYGPMVLHVLDLVISGVIVFLGFCLLKMTILKPNSVSN